MANSEFESGAVRSSNDGRGRFDLIPAQGLQRLAMVAEEGAGLYGANNWKKGIPLHRYLDSAMRHLVSYSTGDRNEDHLARCAWNCLALASTEIMILQGLLPAETDTVGNVIKMLEEIAIVRAYAEAEEAREAEEAKLGDRQVN